MVPSADARPAPLPSPLPPLAQELGDLEKAEEECRAALALYAELFGDSHLHTATCLSNLASLMMQQPGKLHTAESLLRLCLYVHTAELGATHEDSVEVLASRG